MAEWNRVHGIVLAGAYRWGESAFERLGPRPTLPVGLTPLVCRAVRWLRDGGVTRVTVSTNRVSARATRRCLADGSLLGLDVDHVEDWTPRGAAGCVRDAARDTRAERLLVVEGGTVPVVDPAGILAQHRREKAAATVAVSRELGGAAAGRLSPIGVYVFERRVLDAIPDIGYQDLKETVLRRLHAAGEPILPYVAAETCPRVGSARTYLSAGAWVLERMLAGPTPEGFRRVEAGLVHASARLDPSVTLVGPVLIGRAAQLLAGAVVVGPATVGEEATIGPGALCCRSVLLGRSALRSEATVDRCVVAAGAVVQAGTHGYEVVVLPSGPLPDHPAQAAGGPRARTPVPARPPLKEAGR